MSVRLGMGGYLRLALADHRRRSARTDSGCPAGRARPRGGTAPRRPACRCSAGPRWCRRTARRGSPRRSSGSDFGHDAKPWFWLVISTLPVVRSLTGWLAPRWPRAILSVLPPSASASIWWPRQMPNIGMPWRSARGSPARRSRRSPPDRRGRWTGRRRRACGAGCPRPWPSPAHRDAAAGARRGSAGCCAWRRSRPRRRDAASSPLCRSPCRAPHAVSSHS